MRWLYAFVAAMFSQQVGVKNCESKMLGRSFTTKLRLHTPTISLFSSWLEGHSQVPCHFNLHKMCQLEPALKGVAVTIPSHSYFRSTQAPTPTTPLYQPHPPGNPGTLCLCDFFAFSFNSKYIIGQLCKVHRDEANRAKGFQKHWLALSCNQLDFSHLDCQLFSSYKCTTDTLLNTRHYNVELFTQAYSQQI